MLEEENDIDSTTPTEPLGFLLIEHVDHLKALIVDRL